MPRRWLIRQINNSQNNKSFINLYNIVLFIAILGIFLTKSRTVILALLVYIYFVNFHFKSFSYLKIIKSFIFYALLFIIILFLEGDRIIDGIVNENESFNSKYNIFIGYIKNEVSILNLVGGGVFDKQFDTEYGKLFGSAGIMGCIGYYFFFNLLIKCNLSMKPIIFSFLIMSFGTTVLLSLLKIAIILPIIITIISFENNKKFKL